jgi:hypothetical protein
MYGRFSSFTGAAVFLVMMLASAYAQNMTHLPDNVPPPGAASAERPVGVGMVAAPPANFNPLTASPIAHARYAIPPAPDAAIAPRAYSEWRKAVTGPQIRVTPVLTQTKIANGPLKRVGSPVPLANAMNNSVMTSTSINWSGTSVINSNNPFAVEAVIAEFVVPTARQAFGSCTGGWVFSAQWPGIDGNGSNDVLQAGVEADAYCNGGTVANFYSAWVEWYPSNEVRASSPAIHPGDLIYVQVWNTSPTNGYAYFFNFSTLEAAEYQLTAPSGTTLVGNSVEWIVESPYVGGGLATLTNYISVPWPLGAALNYTAGQPTYYLAGLNPPAGTLDLITMVDNSNNGISSATVENNTFLWFQDFGSACGRSGAPPC